VFQAKVHQAAAGSNAHARRVEAAADRAVAVDDLDLGHPQLSVLALAALPLALLGLMRLPDLVAVDLQLLLHFALLLVKVGVHELDRRLLDDLREDSEHLRVLERLVQLLQRRTGGAGRTGRARATSSRRKNLPRHASASAARTRPRPLPRLRCRGLRS
jgi:hypothetical protein